MTSGDLAPRRTRLWARALIRKGHADGATLPRFGTRAWARLDDCDPVKVAACVVAALAWFEDGLALPERLAQEIRDMREASDRIDAEQFAAAAAQVRKAANQPSWNELCRRRGEPQRARESLVDGAFRFPHPPPGPGDYPGRGAA